MKRLFALFLMSLLAVGCGSSGKPEPQAAATEGAKPTTDEARVCVSDYMNQCGWRDVEFSTFADQTELPKEAKTTGDAWAFSFSASYQNIFGERQKTTNWVAVVTRDSGKFKVARCYDEAKQLVGGHTGSEESEKAQLQPGPMPMGGTVDIVAPK